MTIRVIIIRILCLSLVLARGVFACEMRPGETVPIVQFPHKFKENMKGEGYVFQLLKMAIDKSIAKYGPCEPRLILNKLPSSRTELYLEQGDLLQVVDLAVNKERDKRFAAVPIPIDKGLVGNRIFFVRKGESERFAKVKSLWDLAPFTAGQGESWSDVAILRSNGLKVNTTKNIVSLIDMLAHNRFDYFPRGAQEVLTEFAIYKDYAIEVEPELVLSYPYMTAFYVNKDHENLKERLTYGLNAAIDDGSFDRLFNHHPTITATLNDLKLNARRVIHICNPFLPEWVPLNIDKYWLRPWPKALKQGTACLTP